MSFDLPERSPLATLSVVDLSSSQVPRPRGHGGSWLPWPCLKHPCAQRSGGFQGQGGALAACFAQSGPGGRKGGHSINRHLFGFLKHLSWSSPAPRAPLAARPQSWGRSPLRDTASLWRSHG